MGLQALDPGIFLSYHLPPWAKCAADRFKAPCHCNQGVGDLREVEVAWKQEDAKGADHTP